MRLLIGNIHKMGLGTFLAILVPSIALTQTTTQPSPQFYCAPDSRGTLFTQVLIPGREPLQLISWKKTANPRTTCERVSRRFHDFYKAGKLNYIKGGSGIICGTAEDIECNDKRDKLFDLLPYTKATESLADALKEMLYNGSGNPIYQGSDDELVIDFQKILAELRTLKK